jgi:hypothetical protein
MDARYVPAALARPGLVVVTPWSTQSLIVALTRTGQSGTGSNNYPAANVGVFIPFVFPEPCTVTRLFWVNGSAVAGNLDAGVFAEDGTLLLSTGTTAQSGTSTPQSVDVTDTRFDRGRYYLGLTSDTSDVTQKLTSVVPAAGIAQALGLLEDAACAPPFSTSANPATFAAYSRAFIPVVGLTAYRTFAL